MKIHALATIALVSLVFFAQAARAEEWWWTPSTQLSRDYNDNVRLTTQAHESTYGTTIYPKINMGVASEIWQINALADYTRKRYSGLPSLDRDDHSFSLGSSYNTERSLWELNAKTAKTSVISDEFVSPLTGVTQVQKVQDLKSINPALTLSLTERTRLQLSYVRSDVNYVNGVSAQLYDYHTQSTSATLLSQFGPRDTGSLTAAYSYFRVPVTGVVSRGASLQAGLKHEFSGTMHGTFSGGLQNTATVIPENVQQFNLLDPTYQICVLTAILNGTDPTVCRPPVTITSVTLRDSQKTVLYNANLEKQFESSNLVMSLSRQVQPGATGGQAVYDFASIAIDQRLAEKLTFDFALSGNRSSTIRSNVSGVDQRSYQLWPQLRWQWTEDVSVAGSYQYNHLKRASEDKPAISNAVYLTLLYQWPRMDFFR